MPNQRRLEVDISTPSGYRVVTHRPEVAKPPREGEVRALIGNDGRIVLQGWSGATWHTFELPEHFEPQQTEAGVAVIEGTDLATAVDGQFFLDLDCEGGTRPPTVTISNTAGQAPAPGVDDVIGDEYVNVPDKRQWVYAGAAQGWVERPTSMGANVVESPAEPLNLAPGDFWVDTDCVPASPDSAMQAQAGTLDVIPSNNRVTVPFKRRFATPPIVLASLVVVGQVITHRVVSVDESSFVIDVGSGAAGRTYTIDWIAMEATS